MPGDTVQVMKGKDKGKAEARISAAVLTLSQTWLQVTEVLRIFPKWNKILCLGVNYCIKHVRPHDKKFLTGKQASGVTLQADARG